MGKVKDITGQKFGRLTVIEPAPRPNTVNNKHKYWKCRCDCQKEVVVDGVDLRSGNTTSCGCARKGRVHKGRVHKHGMSGTRLYNIHHGMKQRCYDLNSDSYKNYGARGIKICDEFLGENGFKYFAEWALKNGYSDSLTLDRINPDGNYEISNLRWADKSLQSFNRRPRNNKSGHVGIHKRLNGKYRAYIAKNGKQHYFGTYETIEEAVEARRKAERELYPENKN